MVPPRPDAFADARYDEQDPPGFRGGEVRVDGKELGKVGVFVPGGVDNMLVVPERGRAEYYEGETGG